MRNSVASPQHLFQPGGGHVCSPVRVSTETQAARDRRVFWADVVCSQLIRADVQTFGSSRSAAAQPFAGQLDRLDLSGADVCRIQAHAQQVRRTPAQAQSAEEEKLVVVQQSQGQGRLSQAGRTAELHPGDMAVFSSSQPYTLEFDQPFVQYVFILPMQEARQCMGPVQEGLACTWNAPSVGQTLLPQMADALLGWANDAPSVPVMLDAAAVEHWRQTILHTLAAVALPHLQHASTGAERKLAAYHRARIHAVIREHLQDPALSVEFIASKTHLSVAHVHRLFEAEPETVCATVRRLRLEGCRRNLQDPRLRFRSVQDIASDWGFFQPAHFSRLFKSFAGCSPKDWRAQHLPPLVKHPAP